MHIVGNGFIARNFERLSGSYPDALLFGGGVSRSGSCDDAEMYREVQILYDTIHHCRERGYLLIFFSTSSNLMYCGPFSSGLEDGPIFPRVAYARHKLAMESVIRLSGVEYLILRLASPIGHYQKSHQLIPALYEQIRSGTVRIHRGAKRYLIDIDDVVDMTSALLARGVRCQVLNMASLYPTLVEDIVQHLASRLAVPVCKQYIDSPVSDQDAYHVSMAKLAQCIGSSTFESFNFDQDYYKRVIDKYYGPGIPMDLDLSHACKQTN